MSNQGLALNTVRTAPPKYGISVLVSTLTIKKGPDIDPSLLYS